MKLNACRFVQCPLWVLTHPAIHENPARIATYLGALATAWRYPVNYEWSSDRELAEAIAEMCGKGPEMVRKDLRVLRAEGIITGNARVLTIPTDPPAWVTHSPLFDGPGEPITQSGVIHSPAPLLHKEEEKETPTVSRQGGSRSTQPRKRSPLFDALVEAVGWAYDEMTEPSRRQTAVAAAQLGKVRATPAEIAHRAERYRDQFPNVACTPTALAKHWAALNGTTPSKLTRSERHLAQRMQEGTR